MMKISALFLSAVLLLPAAASAQMGPTLSGVTENILHMDENGRWIPMRDWSVKGIKSGAELKTVIFKAEDPKTPVASALWEFKANYDGDWGKTVNEVKVWPEAAEKQKLPEGKYWLSVVVGGEMTWGTAFEVINVPYRGKDHFRVTGPWQNVSYMSTKESQWTLCSWIQSPKDLEYFNSELSDYDTPFHTKVIVMKSGQVVLEKEFSSSFALLHLYPGKVTRYCLSDSGADKILASDGNVDVHLQIERKNQQWEPLVKITLPVKGGKITFNEALSGEKVDPKYRYITSTAYYTYNELPIQLKPFGN